MIARGTSADDLEWAREVDVVVVGSGTGQLAAIRAVDAGSSALVHPLRGWGTVRRNA